MSLIGVKRRIPHIAATAVTLAGCLGGVQAALSQEVIEEVVVTGIRQSQAEALAIKRENVNFVDAISAEDVGKLPDHNIAEALQRVPGIAIQRERGEGDFVSVRGLGPDFVRGTINGRTYTSGTESRDSTLNGARDRTTGRATNFDVLPSEIIDTLEVYKSASADQVEGGIGAVVNITTARPLDLGNAYGGTLRGQHGDFSEETTPSGSGFYSWSNEESFGILTAVSYSDRRIREDVANTFGYHVGSARPAPWGARLALDVDGDGFNDTADAVFPFSANPETFIEDRERLTLNSTLQWLIGDDTEVVADVLWSERDVSAVQYGIIAQIAADIFNPGFCQTQVQNPDGSFPCSRAVIDSNTVVSLPAMGNIEDFTDLHQGEDASLNLGLNVDRQVGAWNISGDLSYADASGDLAYGRTVFSFAELSAPGAGGRSGTLHLRTGYTGSTQGGSVQAVLDSAEPRLTDINHFVIQQTDLRTRRNTDEELALKLDLAYEPEASAVSGVKFGARWRSREKSFISFRADNVGRRNPVLANSIPGSGVRAPGNFLDGGYIGISPGDILFPDHEVILPVRTQVVFTPDGEADFAFAEQTGSTFVAEEGTLAGYVQVDIDGTLADMELSGNAGVRVVSTETDIAGKSQDIVVSQTGTINFAEFVGEVKDFPVSDSYINFLPSLNLRLDINEELLARFAYGRALTRPEFTQLAPALGIINATQYIASYGNPGLTPYLSDNVDLSLEWYFDNASALTAAVFFKQINDYIVPSTNTDIFIAGVTWNTVRQPDNQGVAEIFGFEVGYTQAFTSLPAPFDGLGAVFNLTVVDSSLALNTGSEVPFPGVSDMSINSAIYYDWAPFEARLAYTWRDEFLFDPAGLWNHELLTDDYGQLDFQGSYEIAETITAFVDIVNLTDEQEFKFSNANFAEAGFTRPLSLGQVGRRIGFGVRASF